MNTIELKNYTVTYENRIDKILEIPYIKFEEGLNFILGSNGCGKSTLLKSFTNQFSDVVTSGDIFFNGKIFDRRNVSLVNQNPLISIVQELSFEDNLIFSIMQNFDFISLNLFSSNKKRLAVTKVLREYNLHNIVVPFSKSIASDLSVGQQQLLAISMRLIRSRNILLLDECTANLDESNKNLILTILNEVTKLGCIILFVTHQFDIYGSHKNVYKINNKNLIKLEI